MAKVFDGIQVDSLLFGEGINLRAPVRVATTMAGVLASSFESGDTIDGLLLSQGDRILIKDQAAGVENGFYIVQASGAPVRDEDLLSGDNANLLEVWVEGGTANKATMWVCNNTPGMDVVGTNALTFVRGGGDGVITLPVGTSSVDNQIVRFDGTDGSVQGSAIVLADGGGLSGVGDIVFDEATNDLTLSAADQGTGVATATIPDLGGVSQDFVFTDLTQTLTNKRLDNPEVVNDVAFVETSGTLTMAVTDQVNATATVPDLGGANQDFVFTALAQTLTNKRLDNPEVVNDIEFVEATNNLTLVTTDQTVGASTAIIPDLAGTSQDVVFTDLAQTLTNKSLTNPTVTADITFEESMGDVTMAITDQNNVTATVPDLGGVSQDFVFTAATQTLTNKAFGDDLNMGNNLIINVADPVSNTDATNKQYVDSVASGLDPKESVRVATTADLAGTYTDATPDTITGVATSIDGVTLVVSDRVLVKDQTDPLENGIYVVTAVGATADLERAVDHDGTPVGEVSAGNFTFVEQGTSNSDTGWVLQGDGVLTLNTDNISWTQFSGNGTTVAGDGLTKTGNTFSVNTTGVTTGISADDVIVRSTATSGQVLRSTGSDGTEAAWGALDLANSSAVTGSLTVPNGGTGATTFTSGELLQGNGTGAITSAGIDTAEIVTETGTQTLTNKSFIDASTTILDDVDNTKTFQFQASGITTSTNRTYTVPDADTTLVGTDATQTLSNKTLTEPRFADLGFIADSSGNEMLIFDENATAVNNMQVSNAASSNNPTLSSVGGDANVGLDVQLKGTGVLNLLGTAAQQFQMRLHEDTDNGSNYIALQSPASVAANYTITLPPDDGNSGQLLRTDGNGVTTWVDPQTVRVSYKWLSQRVVVTPATATIVAYHPWDNSEYTDLGSTVTVVFWVEDLNNRGLTVAVHDGSSTIGTITVPATTGNGIQSFTVTKPTSDVRLELRVNKSANGGTSPSIYGLSLEFTA